jgi:arabinofuranan 3-O-arabinosyltransferase
VTDTTRPAVRRVLPYAGFAALCYMPLLVTRPGWISADTKSYLFIDPSRLLSRAWSMWDPQIGLGTVSHQTIGYLWPMGPWFWFFEQIGVPDWVAQRLWWGTLVFAAGTGVVYLLRRFDWPPVAIWPAAVVYALTPYILTHLGRLSGVLLPYAGLPWLLALAILSVRHRNWRYPALFALLVTTVGSVNLTALALVGLAPLLWVAYVAATRQEPVGEVAKAVGRIGVLSTAASAWWLAGLSVQASHGVDIVRYTETAEVVARTSTAFEVLRGLGYWFFYGGDKLQLWIEVSYGYTQRPWLIIVTFAIPVLALLGAAVGRWRHQVFFVMLLMLGAVVAVGAHGWDDSTPFGSAVRWFVTTPRGLAFRSLPRVVPLIALASAVLIGAGVGAVAARWRVPGRSLAALAIVVGVLGLAPLWQRSLVNDNLSRREIPDHWIEATAALDAEGDATRVFELPGSDFASYRWGMTVDPVSPGLMDRPLVFRELVPHGAPMGTDLVNAFDLRLQENTLEPGSIAPIARLLRSGDIAVRSDLEYERHNIARPRVVWDLMNRAPGLGDATWFGDPVPNEAGPILQHLDEQWLLYEGSLPDPPPVAVLPVIDPVPILAFKPAEAPVLVAGDGAGLVDIAAAGLIDGSELIRYTGHLSDAEIRAEIQNGATLLVTDTNRKRGERWGSLRHNRGHTERSDESSLRFDPGDNRLPRFPDAPPSAQTVTIQRGGVTADATAYGNPITYAGEERAARAIDGDVRTAWSVGVFSDARGERLRLRLDEPITLDWIRLQQMSPDDSNRVITQVRITFDGDESIDVALDPSSWEEPGQQITFAERTASQVEVTLVADSAGDPPRFRDFGPLGIVEIVLGPDSPIIDEVIQVPTHAVDAAGPLLADAPLGYVLTRIRQDPTDRTRTDEERSIRRLVDLPVARDFAVNGLVRLSARAEDDVVDQVLGHVSPTVHVSATDRMDGSRVERAAAAFDGDLSTAWTTPWGQPINHALRVEVAEPQVFDRLDLHVVTDGRHSVPTRLEIRVDGRVVDEIDLPALDDVVDFPGASTSVPVNFAPSEGTVLEVEVVEAREVVSIDWTAARPLAHPIAIAELGVPEVLVGRVPDRLDTGCRDDLIRVGDQAVSIRITGATEDALAGRQLDFEVCEAEALTLEAGTHEIVTAAGVDSGIDVDELILFSDAPASAPVVGSTAMPELERVRNRPDQVSVDVTGAEVGRPVWFVFGQSHTDGWVASIDGVDLGPPQQVDAYANGWLISPTTPAFTIDLRFEPQRRVNIALVASALAIAVCLALVMIDRRRRPDLEPASPIGLDATLLRYAGPKPSMARSGMVVGAAILVGLFFGTPAIALLLATAAAVASRLRTARLAIALLPAALLGIAALYVVTWQVRYSIQPGIEWVTELERAHPIALAAVLALPLHPALLWVWGTRPEPDTATPES